MKRLGCIQPSYIPWRGYFHIIQRSDVFVFHEDIQYTKQDWRNRNQVKTEAGLRWLTVPVQRQTSKGTIAEVLIDHTDPWNKKHWRIIEQAYRTAPYFAQYRPFFEDLYNRHWDRLMDLDIAFTEGICDLLGIRTEFVLSSSLHLTGVKTDRLIQMCQKLHITDYLSGPAARDYIEMDKFEAIGVRVEYQNYDYPDYPQLHGAFEPHVSIIDLLFNCGDTALEYLRNEATTRTS